MSASKLSVQQRTEQFEIALHFFHGALCISGSRINDMANAWISYVPESFRRCQELRDGTSSFHITLLSAQECKQVSYRPTKDELKTFQLQLSLFPLGLALMQNAYYVSVHSSDLQRFRSNLGLPFKNLHITLGFQHSDSHAESNSSSLILADSIVNWQPIFELTRYLSIMFEENQCTSNCVRERLMILRHIATCLFQMDEAKNTDGFDRFESMKLIARHCLRELNKEFEAQAISIAEDIAWYLLESGFVAGIRLLFTIWRHTQSQSSLSLILGYFPKPLHPSAQIKLTSSSAAINKSKACGASEKIEDVIREINIQMMTLFPIEWDRLQRPVFCLLRSEALLVVNSLPRNFSWIQLSPMLDNFTNITEQGTGKKEMVQGNPLLAGCAYPTTCNHMLALRSVGIRHVLTVHEQAISSNLCNYTSKQSFTVDLHLVHFHCVDRTPPQSHQLRQMMALLFEWIVVQREAVVVHCQGGVGRTNTVIIAFLMALAKGLHSAADFIDAVAAQRKLILSTSQEEVLKKWFRSVNSDLESIFPSMRSLPTMNISSEKSTALTLADDTIQSEQQQQQHQQQQQQQELKQQLQQESVPLISYADYCLRASAMRLPPLIMFCGLPASGKSTLSTALTRSCSGFFRRINRDEMRGKGECAEKLQEYLQSYLRKSCGHSQPKLRKHGGSSHSKSHQSVTSVVLLDGCHISRAKRSEWLDAAYNVPSWCIAFEYPVEECKRRIAGRKDHPTILNPLAGVAIVEKMSKQYESPSTTEGFERVIVVRNDAEFQGLLTLLRIPMSALLINQGSAGENDVDVDDKRSSANVGNSSTIVNINNSVSVLIVGDKPIKFPRTAHALNLGAATRDDKILSLSDLNQWITLTSTAANKSQQPLHIIIEEKVDGANIGFSLRSSDQRILVQNRSHFISSQYHAQFAPLDKWLAKHSQELWTILEPDRHILYGEWLHATHSVEYNQLSDLFQAFDIFDIVDNVFLSRSQLTKRLQGTSIQQVPVLYQGPLISIEQLRGFVDGPSHFSSSNKREGIVIRLTSEDRLIGRAKLVRSDFIAGNERWNRSAKLQVNQLAH